MKFFVLPFLFYMHTLSAVQNKADVSADAVQIPANTKQKSAEKPHARKIKVSADAAQIPVNTKQKSTEKPHARKIKVSADATQIPANTKQKSASKPQVRKINQLSPEDLNHSMDSVEKLLDKLVGVCQSNHSLVQKVNNFQQNLIEIKQKVRQIKEDFIIRDSSIHSYIHTFDFYLHQPVEFNYEKEIPKNTEELQEYVSGLSLSFKYMYQLAFNVPENIPMNRFPEGWGRSIGTALHCLKNYK